ncbi:MAG: Sua5/YciO/YrdC/YwlC family protein, partial [Candidatus Dependentiae bacterium]|nr:Sua5/YciO/YrdC/YwlC family protein [Candidatus Dependentiae bacterium]
MISKTLTWTQKNTISRLIKSFSENHLVVGTSDTVLGFLAPLTEQGFLLLNKTKIRQEKPYIILVGNRATLEHLVEIKSFQIEKLIECWPAPLTLIFNAKETVPSFMKSKDGTVAVRMPNHQGLLALLQQVPGLFSTSANKAGEPIPNSIEEIAPDIVAAVDYLVIDEQQAIRTLPSTILD